MSTHHDPNDSRKPKHVALTIKLFYTTRNLTLCALVVGEVCQNPLLYCFYVSTEKEPQTDPLAEISTEGFWQWIAIDVSEPITDEDMIMVVREHFRRGTLGYVCFQTLQPLQY